MNLRTYTLPILVLFVFMGVFGVYLMFGPMHEIFGCPLLGAETVICATSFLAHVSHWQSAFAGILLEALLLIGFALVLVARNELLPNTINNHWRRVARYRTPLRPTRMQELLSDGIIHRKEPHLML